MSNKIIGSIPTERRKVEIMMQKLVALFLFSLFFESTETQCILQPRLTVANLYQMRFIDRNTGWIGGRCMAKSVEEIRIYLTNTC